MCYKGFGVEYKNYDSKVILLYSLNSYVIRLLEIGDYMFLFFFVFII